MIENNLIQTEYQYISGASYQVTESHVQRNRNTPYCVAITALEGQYFVSIGNITFTLNPGDSIFIPEHVKHDVWVEETCLISYAHFICRHISLDVMRFLNQDYFLFHDPQIQQYLNKINLQHSQSELFDKIYKDSIIAALVCILCAGRNIPGTLPPSEMWFYDVFRYIQNNMNKPIGVSDLIAQTDFTKTSFHQKFKEIMQISPHEYILSEKMKFAATQLLNGKKVNQTAESIGFCNETYFSKAFKRYWGMSPSQYKERNKQL